MTMNGGILKSLTFPKLWWASKSGFSSTGVDFACDVYLNGTYLGNHEGMFSDFSFDITQLVKLTTKQDPKDNNYLAVRLQPAVRNISLANGRKYRWHGDYNQNIVPTGIWQPVKLVATGLSRITDVYVKPALLKKGATVEVEVELENISGNIQQIETSVVLTGRTSVQRIIRLP